MSDIKAIDVGNEVYDGLMALIGAYIISGISKGVFHKSLGTPESIEGMAKLAIAIGIGAALADMLQTKGWVPETVFGGTSGAKTEGREIADEVYHSMLSLIGAYFVSKASQGLLKKSLGAPQTIEGGVKLAVALGFGAAGVTYLQNKEWLPTEAFKKKS